MNNLDHEFIREYRTSCVLCSICKKFIYVNPTLMVDGWVNKDEFCKGICKLDEDMFKNPNYESKKAIRRVSGKLTPEEKRALIIRFWSVYGVLAILMINSYLS